MRKRARIVIIFFLIAIVGGLLWQRLRPTPPDPVYQGKPLSTWLKSFGKLNEAAHNGAAASDAVRHIGTNALPMLSQMIGSKDSKKWWRSSAKFINSKLSFLHLPEDPGEDRRYSAMCGFQALGPAAKPALPELTQILFKQLDNNEASMALVYIGREAIPPLVDALTNSDLKIRSVAIFNLGLIGEMSADGDAVVPILINCLHNKNDDVRVHAAVTLKNFEEQSGIIVPALMECLKNEDFKTRAMALFSLRKFGAAARMALPAIRNALVDKNEKVRGEATNALLTIDPELAAKARIK